MENHKWRKFNVTFEVLTSVVLTVPVSWDDALSLLLSSYWHCALICGIYWDCLTIEDEGAMILCNFGTSSHSDTVSHYRILKSWGNLILKFLTWDYQNWIISEERHYYYYYYYLFIYLLTAIGLAPSGSGYIHVHKHKLGI